MIHPSRRDILHGVASVGVQAALAPLADRASPASDGGNVPPLAPSNRDFVIGAGLTPEEADCWAATAEAAGKFFALPELHPMDRQEVASAIHIIQNKLLSRPTYRKYLELAKATR